MSDLAPARPAAPPPALGAAAERRLVRRAQAGDDEARDVVLRANLAPVRAIARQSAGRGVPADDLFQEGALGLLAAIGRFDAGRGVRLASYARWWIREAVLAALREDRPVRLTRHAARRMAHLERTHDRLGQQLGREPGAALVARAAGCPVAEVGRWRGLGLAPLSLDRGVEGHGAEDDAGGALGERLVSPPDRDPADRAAIRDALRRLPVDERRVLALRLGLLDDRARTLEETGRALGVSRETARRGEQRALARLRCPAQGRAREPALTG